MSAPSLALAIQSLTVTQVQHRYDDLEPLHMLVHFLRGHLPCQDLSKGTDYGKAAKLVTEIKAGRRT